MNMEICCCEIHR